MRDDDLATFWQSDGAQPHVVNAQFQHKAELCEIALWCEYKMDESYTPSLISIRAGASCHDLREVRLVELEQPNGWVRVRLRGVDDSSYLRAYFIQIAVLSSRRARSAARSNSISSRPLFRNTPACGRRAES